MSVLLSGIGVSRGVAIGKAHVAGRDQPDIPQYRLTGGNVEAEVERLQQAVERASRQLEAIRESIPDNTPADVRGFIDTHLLMLSDASLSQGPARLIRDQRMNAEWAVKQQRDTFVQVFEAMDDPYLRTRRDDVDHVINRILRVLLDLEPRQADPGQPLDGCIVVADDLTPADTVLMYHQGAAALVTGYGGPLSHTAILARSLGIPAVAGVRSAWRLIAEGETVIVDGHTGHIVAEPDEPTLEHFRRRQVHDHEHQVELRKLKGTPAVTADGRPIAVHANVELPEDLTAAREVRAAGVGLYRTEFLFMNRDDLPDEQEQLETYVSALEQLAGMPLTIRTLDLGADKASEEPMVTSGNPALGLRAIRLCLRDLELFVPQLRAILRASAHGPVRMMLPMLSNLQEVEQVLQLVEETKQDLRREGLGYDEGMPVGGMIEVPSAALCAHMFARRLDFLSIGTNDLIQYTLAIDRVDDAVNYLYDPLHPAVLRLIHTVLQAGRRATVPVSMCGEMAGDIRYTRLLLGLGLTEFSMHPSALLDVKQVIKQTTVRPLRVLARRALRSESPAEVTELMEHLNADTETGTRLAQ